MPGPTTEVLSDDLKELRADVHRIDVGLAALTARIDVCIKVATWGTTIVVSLIGGSLIGGLVTGSWWASKITSRVEVLESRFDKLEASIAKVLEQTKKP